MMTSEDAQQYLIQKIAHELHMGRDEDDAIRARAVTYYCIWFELSEIEPEDDDGIYRNHWIPSIAEELHRLRKRDEEWRARNEASERTRNALTPTT